MSNKRPPLPFALLFVGFWSLLTLIFDGMLVFNAYRQFRANSYPVATGTMTHSEVSVHHGDDSTTYGVDVKYEYQVDGRRYEGDRYRYGQWNSSDDSAQKIVDSLPVGKQVDVRYNPADPADSVLAVGIQSGDLFLALFLTPFNLVMLGGWCTVVAILFPGISSRMAGPPSVIKSGVHSPSGSRTRPTSAAGRGRARDLLFSVDLRDRFRLRIQSSHGGDPGCLGDRARAGGGNPAAPSRILVTRQGTGDR